MRVSCSIATISYNSEKWLVHVLERLIKAEKLEYAYYIKHQGEGDDKDHIHVWTQPAERVQTLELKPYFNELDPKHPDKPLGVLPFRLSKVKDWIQYVLHNPVYLMQHRNELDEVAKIPYDPLDIKVVGVDRVQFERDLRSSYSVLQTSNITVSKMLMQGESAIDALIMSNANPQFVLATLALLNKDREIGAHPAILQEVTKLLDKGLSDKSDVSRETLSDKKGS